MTRMSRQSLGFLGCCLLLACSSSPPIQYHTLKAIAPAAAIANASNQIVVRVQPVVIPPELDRLQLVSRSGPYSVHIADSDRWAAPLDDQVRRVVSDDLTARLPPNLVADPNEPATNDPRRLLSVEIADFYSDDTCATTLRANWTLRSPNGDSARGTEQLQIPGSESCNGAVPAAMSAALAALSDRLAAVIVGQAAGSTSP
jgi:uncharacterized lipoprotein YmbA